MYFHNYLACLDHAHQEQLFGEPPLSDLIEGQIDNVELLRKQGELSLTSYLLARAVLKTVRSHGIVDRLSPFDISLARAVVKHVQDVIELADRSRALLEIASVPKHVQAAAVDGIYLAAGAACLVAMKTRDSYIAHVQESGLPTRFFIVSTTNGPRLSAQAPTSPADATAGDAQILHVYTMDIAADGSIEFGTPAKRSST